MPAADGPVLLYDADCGFCSRVVQFVLRHERGGGTLQFAGLRSAYAQRALARFPELRHVDSMVWLGRDREGAAEVLVRSAAALRLATYLGGYWRWAAVLAAVVPRVVRDMVYRTVARHRMAAAPHPSCYVADDSQRARFID